MRALVIGLLGIAAEGTAPAETRAPALVAGFAYDITFQSLGMLRVDGFGIALDAAHRVGDLPISLVVDGAALWAETTIDGGDPSRRLHATGAMERLGGSMRWIPAALEWRDSTSGSLELRLDAGAGMQSLDLGQGRLTRPDSWLGTALQIRIGNRWALQVGYRVGFAPPYEAASVARTICRGDCMGAHGSSPLDTSWTILIGAGWAP
jgi:hypothetical protein